MLNFLRLPRLSQPPRYCGVASKVLDEVLRIQIGAGFDERCQEDDPERQRVIDDLGPVDAVEIDVREPPPGQRRDSRCSSSNAGRFGHTPSTIRHEVPPVVQAPEGAAGLGFKVGLDG